METSPDTENMVFFSKDLLEDIEWTAGNSMGNESQLLGFYPIIGTNGRESIKLLSNGEEAANSSPDDHFCGEEENSGIYPKTGAEGRLGNF